MAQEYSKIKKITIEKLISEILEEGLNKKKLEKCLICNHYQEIQNMRKCSDCGNLVCCGYVSAKEQQFGYDSDDNIEGYMDEDLTYFCYKCLEKDIENDATGTDLEDPKDFTYNIQFYDDYFVEDNIEPRD